MTIMAVKQFEGQQDTRGASSFKEQASAVLIQLRSAFAALVGSLPGGGRRPTDIQNALGLDVKLCWRVHKVATSTNPLSAGAHVPGITPLKRLCKAALRQGVPSEVIDTVSDAYSEFETLVQVHAGSRTDFDSMISAYAEDTTNQIDIQHRRAAFRSNSHIWGVQARTQLKCLLVAVSETDPNEIALAHIQGFVDLRRFRPAASLLLAGFRVPGKSKRGGPSLYDRKPLFVSSDKSSDEYLIREFSSLPTPQMQAITLDDGDVRHELKSDGVGNESAVTCMIGDVTMGVPGPYSDDDPPELISNAWIRTPSEVLIHDVILDKSLKPESVAAAIYADHNRSGGAPVFGIYESGEVLKDGESVEALGSVANLAHIAEVSRYPEMINATLDSLGWDPRRFNLYRSRVLYPVMPSTVLLKFDFPEKSKLQSK